VLKGEEIIESAVSIEHSPQISLHDNSPPKSKLHVVIPHNQESALKLRTQTQGAVGEEKNETASM
jgi:hypothetical protein